MNYGTSSTIHVLTPSGGDYNTAFLASTEIFDPATGIWTNTGSLAGKRYYPTATLMPSGKVFVTGGLSTSPALCRLPWYH